MGISVATPASTANIGPGFDVLGLALGLYNKIDVRRSTQELTLTVTGEGRESLAANPEDNLAVVAMRRFYEALGTEMPPLDIRMENGIPLARGLGSSAATIVGALAAANVEAEAGWSADRIFNLAVELEGHADNVAAAVYGGLTIAYKDGDGYRAKPCRPASNVGVVVLLPETALSTKKARSVLPEQVSLETAVFNIGRTALLVEALLTGEFDRLAAGCEDLIHQPGRKKLIDDFEKVVGICYEAGAAGAALSGAGPTINAFYDLRAREEFSQRLAAGLVAAGSARRALFIPIDNGGVNISLDS